MTPYLTPFDRFLATAKAWCALAGAIATALLAVYAADSDIGTVLTVVAVVATAVGTWVVPNASGALPELPESAYGPDSEPLEDGYAGLGDVLTLALIVLVVVVILVLLGVLKGV